MGHYCNFVTFKFERCDHVDAVLTPSPKLPQLPGWRAPMHMHSRSGTQLYGAQPFHPPFLSGACPVRGGPSFSKSQPFRPLFPLEAMDATLQCPMRRSPRLLCISLTPTIRKTEAAETTSLTIGAFPGVRVSDVTLSRPVTIHLIHTGENDQNVCTPDSGTVGKNPALGLDRLQQHGFRGPEDGDTASISEIEDGAGTKEAVDSPTKVLPFFRASVRML